MSECVGLLCVGFCFCCFVVAAGAKEAKDGKTETDETVAVRRFGTRYVTAVCLSVCLSVGLLGF